MATLLRDHVRVTGDVVTFAFPAKSGVDRTAQLRDPQLATAVAALRRRRTSTGRLLRFAEDGEWHDLASADINSAFRALVGPAFTVKDLRTWAATVLAAAAFAEQGTAPSSRRARARVEREVMTLVADHLGNTPAVARRSYVDPRVVDAYAGGRTVLEALRRLPAGDRVLLRRGELSGLRRREALERSVRRLIG